MCVCACVCVVAHGARQNFVGLLAGANRSCTRKCIDFFATAKGIYRALLSVKELYTLRRALHTIGGNEKCKDFFATAKIIGLF